MTLRQIDEEQERIEGEPDCTCVQIDVDEFDNSGCEFHNPNSKWRQEITRFIAECDRESVEAFGEY